MISFRQKAGEHDFPVRRRDAEVVSSLSISEILNNVPVIAVDWVFSERQVLDKVKEWLDSNKAKTIRLGGEGDDDE